MGNDDKWTTPKQIKIERKGDPRPLRRGPLKKGERRKGKKARIDELLSSRKTLQQYAKWILDERQRRIDHPEWYIPRKDHLIAYDPHYEEYFDKHSRKHRDLLAEALTDGVIDSVREWLVGKP